jgi:hypothetical protein
VNFTGIQKLFSSSESMFQVAVSSTAKVTASPVQFRVVQLKSENGMNGLSRE